jgi:prevent-host-death family protein
MGTTRTISATEFKAKCLDILDRLHRREWDRVVVTKRGVAVGVLVPPSADASEVERLHGLLRGSVIIPPGVDLAAPASDDQFDAEQGLLHR